MTVGPGTIPAAAAAFVLGLLAALLVVGAVASCDRRERWEDDGRNRRPSSPVGLVAPGPQKTEADPTGRPLS